MSGDGSLPDDWLDGDGLPLSSNNFPAIIAAVVDLRRRVTKLEKNKPLDGGGVAD